MLKLDCVNISYGAIQAVREVSLEVPKGQVVTIIGANGAGKSTLLKSVVGLEPLVTGRVFLDGKDVTSIPAHKRTKLGVALSPEGRGVFPDQTVQTVGHGQGHGHGQETGARGYTAIRDGILSLPVPVPDSSS